MFSCGVVRGCLYPPITAPPGHSYPPCPMRPPMQAKREARMWRLQREAAQMRAQLQALQGQAASPQVNSLQVVSPLER